MSDIWSKNNNNRTPQPPLPFSPGIMRSGVAVIVILIAGVLALMNSWYTVDQGDRGILLTNGALSTVTGPGLHFKVPFLQRVEKISLRQQVVRWGSDQENGGGLPVMQGYSRDQQPADMRVTVNFHVPESEVANVYANYGSLEALADRVIARKAPQEIKTVFGQYDAVSVIQNRAKFNKDVSDAISKVTDGPVMIDSVQVENINFSSAYEQAVEARMTAQVEVQKQEQNLQQEKIKADIAVTQAQGRASSVKAEADASAYKTKIEGEATADAIRLRAAALANNPLLVDLTKAERWNGELPTTMVPGSATPFIDVTPTVKAP
ncbi:prohibitin family protein [Aestuariivirga litoralis]|uniref:prohibitin family protein n=1 Tax=Aestuariivirga litoralis TaxID=2650924 RepID=UPI001FEE2FB2|nr:prohibitin family protein [Aestuariivirga litoralis]MBG1231700.1 prohibitin family protein [Aestuariivirga litoralis]